MKKIGRITLEIEIEDIEMNDKQIKIVVGSGLALLAFAPVLGKSKTLKESVPYRDLIIKYASGYSLDPCLVAAVIKKESDFDPTAVNPNDPSYGLGQITLNTASQFQDGITKHVLFQPEKNIQIMCQFINWLRGSGVPMPDGISAYNTGFFGWQSGYIPNPPDYSEVVKIFMKELCK